MHSLYNVKTTPPILLAQIDDEFEVQYLHPLLQRTLLNGTVIIPSINKFTALFDGRTRIPTTDKDFGKALLIHLKFEYVTHPETYFLLSGNAVLDLKFLNFEIFFCGS